ncbi:phosphatidylserine/phosphatidylglycerophosphate/cardiolipin synthase family protein [Pendulispora rubella]
MVGSLGCAPEASLDANDNAFAEASALEAEPDPVMNKAVFNDPIGTKAAQNAIFIQFARLIDRVPAGEEIQMSFFGWDPPDTDDTADDPDLGARLLAAHARGVRVKVILDLGNTGNAAHTRLANVLGGDDSKPSYVVTCNDQFPNGPKRGCIGTRVVTWSDGSKSYAYNHNKFALFSKVALSSGVVSNVVFQGSSNMGLWDTNESYNNMLTWSDAGTYGAFRTYFEDLRRYRRTSGGNNDYYWATPTGTDYKVHFFPRHERSGQPLDDAASDTVYNALQSVTSCRYNDNGVTRQTDVRVAMWAFNRSVVARKLTQLSKAGCWVDVVFSEASDASLNELRAAGGPQLTRCNFHVGPGIDVRVHSKYMLVDGAYDDDIVPRVFTGSHNYAYSALRQADETLVRVMGRAVHTDYLNNFYRLRDTCRARGGIIR